MIGVLVGIRVDPEHAENHCEECDAAVAIPERFAAVVADTEHVCLCTECVKVCLLRGTRPLYLADEMHGYSRANRMFDRLIDEPAEVPEEIETALKLARHPN